MDKSDRCPRVTLPSSLVTGTTVEGVREYRTKDRSVADRFFRHSRPPGGLRLARLADGRPGRRGGAREPAGEGDRPRPHGGALPIRRRRDPDLHRSRPRRHRAPDRREGAGRRHPARLDRLRAHQRHRRAGGPPPRRAPFPPHLVGRRLARSRLLAHRRHHGKRGHQARARGQSGCGRVPHHPGPRHDGDVRRRAALVEPAAGLSLAGRRLQGARQRPHPLQGHHHRHRGPARSFSHDRLRREGRADLSRRRRPGLGGARLFVHRFRLLPAHLPDQRDGGADLSGRGRGGSRGDAPRLPVRLSQSQPLARALQPRHRVLARLPGRPRGARRVRSAGRVGRRAHLRSRRSPESASSSSSISRRTATIAP